MFSFNLLFAKKFFSSDIANGTGVSSDAQRMTGASKYSNKFSLIHAAISAPIPPVKVSSCRIKTFPVFFTVVAIASLSKGKRVLRSSMSAVKLSARCQLFLLPSELPHHK
jgi:hypothetical protein